MILTLIGIILDGLRLSMSLTMKCRLGLERLSSERARVTRPQNWPPSSIFSLFTNIAFRYLTISFITMMISNALILKSS